MSTSVYCPDYKQINLPCIHRVSLGEPLAWLASGWNDFRCAWPVSMPYGFLLGIMGLALIYYTADRPYLTMALAGGFMLIAPAVAIMFYQVSRRLEWSDSGRIGARPPISRVFNSNIALFGLLLAMIFAIWIDLAAITTALMTPRDLAMPDAFSLLSLFRLDNLAFVMSYFAIGALLAVMVFCTSVITLPMLMDRDIDLVTAITTSMVIVRENPAAMLFWAATITLLVGLGMFSLFIGFAVIFPVLGHASWHAYRGLVAQT